jgi:hypothetical protein
MFRRSNSFTAESSKDTHINNTAEPIISLNLDNNRLIFKENGTWSLQSSDLDCALLEIDKLIDEKEVLVEALSESVNQIQQLSKEIIEVNGMKTVVLEMVLYVLVAIFFHLLK